MENHIGNLMSRVSQNTPRHVNTINVSNNEDITQNISNITKVMPSISYELSINDSSIKKSSIMTSSFISSDSSKKFKPLTDYEIYQEAKEKGSHVDSMCTAVARTGSHIRNWEDLLNFNFRYHDFAKDLSFYDKRVKVAQEVLNEQGTEYERKKSLQSNFWFDEDEPVIHSIAVSKKYENDNLLKNDSMKRIQSRIFMCHICGQMLKGRSSFRSHIARHSKVKQYKCKYCLRSFSQSSTLKNHVRIHTGERPFSCLVCNESFRTSSSHHKHLTKHSFSRPFKCDICKKAFKSKPTLNVHYKMHDGKPLNCNSCDSTFPSKRALSYHIQKVHIRQKLFKCNVCNKEYATKHNLSQHMAFHSSEKNYSCIICKSSFVWKSGLAAHMKVHSLKIQCDHCGDKFTSSKKLEKHRRRHTTPISHSCSKCDKKFKYLYLLKKHIQRHDKDITCSICGSTFMKKSIFNEHISSHEESEKDIRT